MRNVFEDWNEDPEHWWKYLLLAHTFTAIDDDANALAAWSLLAPRPLPSGTDDQSIAKEEQPNGIEGETISNRVEEDTQDENNQAIAGAAASPDGTTHGDAESEIEESSEELEADIDSDVVDEIDTSSKSDEDSETDSSGLRGWLNSYCDGCGSGWTYVDDIYCCKDCVDVQLEPDCYAKLNAGELDPTVCAKGHEHLHIPPFEEAKRRDLAIRDMVVVGDTPMPRTKWLESIRQQWGVQQEKFEQIKLQASSVRAIERFWKVVQSRRRAPARET